MKQTYIYFFFLFLTIAQHFFFQLTFSFYLKKLSFPLKINFQLQENDFKNQKPYTVTFTLPIMTISPDLLPPRVSLDYEALLRSSNPSIINYNSKLRDILSNEEYMEIDELYGKIYDKEVLLKQIAYFLKQDDFSTIRRMLIENRFVLSKEQTSFLIENILHLLYIRFYFKQQLPNIQPLQLITKRKNINKDIYTMTEFFDSNSQKFSNFDFNKSCSTELNKTISNNYNFSITSLNTSLKEEELSKARDEIQSRYLILRKGVFRHGCERSKKKLNKWKYRRKVKLEEISPYLAKPFVIDPIFEQEVNKNFTNAIELKDWKTACLILRKHTRLIKVTSELVSRFLNLYQLVHADSTLTEKQKTLFRSIWYTTLYKPRVVIKLLEVKAHLTLQDLELDLEKQRQAHRDKKMERNYQRWLKKGVNLDDYSNDFSDAKGYDWIFELYGSNPIPVVSPKKMKNENQNKTNIDSNEI